jgi:hypothetical protein
MGWVKNVASELLGLFVDDGSFVLVVIAWMLISAFVLRLDWLDPGVGAVLLFAGIAALVVENVRRTARAHLANKERR